jgi:3-deoxy-manno-octulosonate cytidylyltransferase (CMP-KDO synthetase)
MDKVLAVIPARYASTRLPGKVIEPVAGRPMVWHVWDRARRATLVDGVLVATDDLRVVEALAPHDVPVMMTQRNHACGTDRLAEVATRVEADVLVNVQGDEPLIDPRTIDAIIGPLRDDPTLLMSTARHRITDPERIADPSVVKVVCDRHGRALYFSRSPIPAVRDMDAASHPGEQKPTSLFWQHVGLYAYRRQAVLQFAAMEPTPLERSEKLEQLRALENGWSIAVVETEHKSVGVDTPDDLARVRRLLAA